MPIDQLAMEGAKRILQHGFGVEQDQEILILADETTVEVATTIAEAAYAIRVQPTIVLVPVSEQQRIPEESQFTLITEQAVRQSNGIVTCVNGSPECLPFRISIMKAGWHVNRRCGHMPGATLDVLKLANVDFAQITHDCRRLEAPLARGRALELISKTLAGEEHRLSIDIGGWDRLPIASDGVIHKGAWGNTPSGETYIAPVEGKAHGSVVINGSMPGLVIAPGSDLILHFEHGRMSRMEPDDSPTAAWLRVSQIDKAMERDDPNWSNLAEIGIGVNPAVHTLTGNMLFDEKAAGTAHVALGRNKHMGGTVDSAIHCDMTVLRPTIRVDGITIVREGELTLDDRYWQGNYQDVDLPDPSTLPLVELKVCSRETQRGPNEGLERLLRPQTGRVSEMSVGDAETAQRAGDLYSRLSLHKAWVAVGEIAHEMGWPEGAVYQVSRILEMYDLVEVRTRDAHTN